MDRYGRLQEHQEDHENDVRARIEEDSQPVELERLGLSDGPRDPENTTGEVHRAKEWQAEKRYKADDISTARVSI